jgi:hypothetical protein
MADEGLYVVVSIADNGIVHAWGAGPAGPQPVGTQPVGTVVPFSDRTEARRVRDGMARREKQEMLEEGEQVRVMFKVCKVLGTETAEVKFD